MQERKLWIAYLLWFFLGLLGVHLFYLKKPMIGVIYIFTAGIFGFGWLLDLFTLPKEVRMFNEELSTSWKE